MHRLFLGRNVKAGVIRLVLLLVTAMVMRRWVMMPVLLQGPSMQPTCQDGQFAVVNKLAYLFRPPQRGDLVCVWTGKELYNKRIVGLPGDEIAIRDGILYMNGQPFPEPYVTTKGHWNVAAGELGADHFAVAGDNRSIDQQQAALAVVSQDRIVGRLMIF